ncbi:MAG: TOMM precursor leader peptide-binding protein [Chloroflexota bacterium]|nr:TOMM precursor leader peptide-binding protein [Chloroflexota bacterium]
MMHPSALHVIGGGLLAAEIAVTIRTRVSSRQIIARDVMPESDAFAESAFIIGVAEGDATGLLHTINRAACRHGIPWLPIRAMPDTVRFGPTIFPGATACLLCITLRERANGPNPPTVFPVLPRGRPERRAKERGPGSEVPTLATLEVLQTLIGEPSCARGRLGLLNVPSGVWTWHPVLRHPRCPVCGGLPWPPFTPPSPVGIGAFSPLVDNETGIVRAVLPVPPPSDEPTPPHVALAILPNTQFRDDWAALPPSEHTTIGKGWTVEDARRAAIGEALERYCAMLPPPPATFRVAPLATLDCPAIGPEAFGLYHPTQYADGSAPYAPVTPDTPLHWVEGRSLTHDHPTLVPASLVYLLPLDAFCQQTSNGLAAGRTVAEASLRALCEVIERDAFLVGWLTRHAAPLLDLCAVGDAVARIVHWYAARGVTLTAHDLTTTTGVPTILTRAHDERGRPPIDLIGLGCDPDPRRAVERAALEVVQGRYARWDELAAQGTSATVRTPADHGFWYALRDRSNAFAFLGAQSGLLPVRIGNADNDAETLLAAIVALLAHAGHETVIVEITTPDVRSAGTAVVRALVTGLLPIHFGVGQERLGSPRLVPFPIASLNRLPHPLA